MNRKSKLFLFLLLLFFNVHISIAEFPLFDLSYIISQKQVNNNLTQIEVKERNSDHLVYKILLEDVYKGHYHPFEFHNGNLYVIRRTGGELGYEKHPNTWTDALWKYDQNKNGEVLYSVRGLDFRISPDERTIAINALNDTLFLLDSMLRLLHTLTTATYNVDGFGNLCLTNSNLFFSNGGPESSFGLIIKVNLSNLIWTRQDIPKLSFEIDYQFNPFNETVVGSEYPFFYDSYEHDQWYKDHPIVKLYLYDFKSHKLRVLAKSKAKIFHPKWIDNSHIEFTDPSSSKRITINIAN